MLRRSSDLRGQAVDHFWVTAPPEKPSAAFERVLYGTAAAVILLSPSGADAQAAAPAEVQLPTMESVFRIATPYGDGSGFLVDISGLVLTNAHVTGGQASVDVQINAAYKVRGFVTWEDEAADIALIQVHPEAVSGLTELPPSLDAFDNLEIGDPVQVVGFPLGVGQTLSRGILSQNPGSTLLTDASVNPGMSGGPMVDAAGNVVGVASFLVAEALGPGGGVGASQIVTSAGPEWAALRSDSLPPPDSLPVMPTDRFPLADLDKAATATEWPIELYDVSDSPEERLRHYTVRLFTPMVQHFIASRGDRAQTPAGQQVTFIRDLRYWNMDMGAYSPVIIVRITPRIAQSAGAFWGNVLLGTLAGASGSYYTPVNDPEFRASVRRVLVQEETAFVQPIQVRFVWSTMNGQAAKAAYVVIDPRQMCSGPEGERRWTIFAVDEVMIPYVLPDETIAQVCSDFDGYLTQGVG